MAHASTKCATNEFITFYVIRPQIHKTTNRHVWKHNLLVGGNIIKVSEQQKQFPLLVKTFDMLAKKLQETDFK